MSEAYEYDPGAVKSIARRVVRPSDVDRVAEEVGAEYGIPAEVLRNTEIRAWGSLKQDVFISARHKAWRRLAQPDISVASIGRAWPADHTSILAAVGRTKKNRKPA